MPTGVVKVMSELRRQRELLGYSQRRADPLLGIFSGGVSKMERFEFVPKFETLMKYATCVHCEVKLKFGHETHRITALENIEDLLASRRLRLGMTLGTVAEGIGCSRSSVCRWERHIEHPLIERQFKWAELLGGEISVSSIHSMLRP